MNKFVILIFFLNVSSNGVAAPLSLVAEHFDPNVNSGVQSVNFFNINGTEKVLMTSGYKSGVDFFSKKDLKHERGFSYSEKKVGGRPVLLADLAMDEEGLLYATSYRLHKVLVFNLKGQLVRSWGGKGVDEGQFQYPIGIDYSKKTKLIYVADFENRRFQVFNRQGQFQFQFGRKGWGQGEFTEAYDIKVIEDKIFTADRSNNRLQVFDLKGRFLYQIGAEKNKFGYSVNFHFPQHMAVDSKKRLYVADSKNYRVVVMSLEGKVLAVLEGDPLKYPKGVAIGANDEIVVSEFKEFQPGKNEVKNPVGGLRLFKPLPLEL